LDSDTVFILLNDGARRLKKLNRRQWRGESGDTKAECNMFSITLLNHLWLFRKVRKIMTVSKNPWCTDHRRSIGISLPDPLSINCRCR
jgi:hypothetical protein